MKTVSEIARMTGISIKTLHHYDRIGLLKPDSVTDAGYRLYGENALKRLNSILLFREVRFPLKDIQRILDTPGFDPRNALLKQIELLESERDRIGKIIDFARTLYEKGESCMDYTVFDKNAAYEKETRDRWGDTKAYQAYEEKKKSGRDFDKASREMMEIFASIGRLMHLSSGDAPVQEEIKRLQSFISENFYPCTNEILKGLGQMYVMDERFKENIDKAGGCGTAEFTKEAISFYVKD